MQNPTIDELRSGDGYELEAELDHRKIREFVIGQLSSGHKMIPFYMVYQAAMMLAGIFFITRSLVLLIRGYSSPVIFLFLALVFSFSVLVVIHELLHGLALKLTGAGKVIFGGDLKKFIFYAAADRHVLNRKQFSVVALTPLLVVQGVTLVACLLTAGQPSFYFWITVMSAHSLFCAGDILLLSFFCRFPEEEVYTFDIKAEKKSYFYRKKSNGQNPGEN